MPLRKGKTSGAPQATWLPVCLRFADSSGKVLFPFPYGMPLVVRPGGHGVTGADREGPRVTWGEAWCLFCAVLKCFELVKVPAVHAGAEWAESGKLQPAGGSSFSGTFAAVNETHDLSGCQLLLLHTRLSQNCHKGQSLIFCGKAGLRSFTSLVNLILQDSACTARHRSSPLLQHGSCSSTRSKIPPDFKTVQPVPPAMYILPVFSVHGSCSFQGAAGAGWRRWS